MPRPIVVFGFLGTSLDNRGVHDNRWRHWRPNVALHQHAAFPVARAEIFVQPEHQSLFERVAADIAVVSSGVRVLPRDIVLKDPWDFEEVYALLHDFARGYDFRPDEEDYYVQITTGTHVAQICLFLLTEARYFPAKLLQLGPSPASRASDPRGRFQTIDLDLSKYDRIATRFAAEQAEGAAFLKAGVATRNAAFNALIAEIETVAIRSDAPVLLTGPTGAGKTHLARRIYELKKARRRIKGAFVEVNCATLRGDQAMSTLFGHRKGAFTGALSDRPGLMKAAHGGMLFLDEIGELGLDEQAMTLRALEEKRFTPMGSDREETSDFLLIAGTNRDLQAEVRRGRFRADLLERLDLWSFRLPGLAERREDVAPNLEFELQRHAARTGERAAFNREGLDRFLGFAESPDALWSGNFRELTAAVTRMATLAPMGRIDAATAEREIDRLKAKWRAPEAAPPPEQALLEAVLGAEKRAEIDLFDQAQLAAVIGVCRESASLSEAGRRLFAASRAKRESVNDADRLRKYLARFDLDWEKIRPKA